MEEFGHFCEAYYGTKALEPRLKHLLHWKNNKESLDRFADRIEQLRRDLIGLLSQQAVQQPSKHVEILAQLESQLSGNRAFYSSIRDEKEDIVEAFLSNHGGEAAVRMNGNLLNRLATSVGESVTQGIANAIKETAETTLKQSQASFALKLRYTLDQWVSGSQQKVQTDTNPEAKAIWKNTAAMESIVDSQQLVGGVNRYYDTQFRKYQVDNPHAEHNDAWTRSIISNVHLHSAIGGAIGDDGCGNITVIDFNKFIHKKPAKLSVPQWVAYGAYGWGADNQLYRDEVNKIYAQLEKHMDHKGRSRYTC
ncbi:hypothetical protein F5148DRAFT_531517 [Russula earlei]|uniref:Uncharacterized protein n=1 Tax=Russula earlei TaxID=71964 RepID=A0ACC0TY64_9AGAM|nr:hypothetical protein F5148DRAFT_531517 [Russula earlei]